MFVPFGKNEPEGGELFTAPLEKPVKQLRTDLEAKWTPVASVPESNAGIYARGDPAGESMAGLAVLTLMVT
jgi:hypothetical protein